MDFLYHLSMLQLCLCLLFVFVFVFVIIARNRDEEVQLFFYLTSIQVKKKKKLDGENRKETTNTSLKFQLRDAFPPTCNMILRQFLHLGVPVMDRIRSTADSSLAHLVVSVG